jgi:hypothetical protein
MPAITICQNEDMSGQSRRAYSVLAAGSSPISINEASSPGWSEVDEDHNTSGNPVSGTKKWCTVATYRIDSPGDDVTLIVDCADEGAVVRDLGQGSL